MIGAVVGFLTGILSIILIAFDPAINNLLNLPVGGTSVTSIELRLLIVIACTVAGFFSGLQLGQFFSMESPGDGTAGALAQYAIGQGADKKHGEPDDEAWPGK